MKMPVPAAQKSAGNLLKGQVNVTCVTDLVNSHGKGQEPPRICQHKERFVPNKILKVFFSKKPLY